MLSNEDGTPLPGVNVVLKGTTIGTVTDLNGYYTLPVSGSDAQTVVYSFIGMATEEIPIKGRKLINVTMNSDVTQLSEVVAAGYGLSRLRGYNSYNLRYEQNQKTVAATPVVRQTTIEFAVTEPYTIQSGEQRQTVDMVEYDLPAIYQYFCIPKLDVDVFLTARITDWEGYNFIPGEANLFFEGKYIGKTVLNTQEVKDTLDISLGRDKSVVITREKIKDFSSTQFIGSNVKELVGFEISIRNKKSDAINIIVEDQVPIALTKEIEIDLKEFTEAGRNKVNGKLKWEFNLDSGQSKSVKMIYEVKYPKNRALALE